MSTIKLNLHYRAIIRWLLLPSITFCLFSCDDSLLDEKPLSSLSADIVLTSKTGFENYLVGLVWAARQEIAGSGGDNHYHITNFPGTDIADDAGVEYFTYRNWISYMTPVNTEVRNTWNWAYTELLPQANTIIVYARKPDLANIWASEDEKNAVIAEARFFRGYTYNLLANLYGGVPIVDTIITSPKFDYVRATRQEVYEFAKADLEFASRWLPATVVKAKEGRIVKAAADHLLSEVYISLGEYDNAIASASRVISSPLYRLMTTRFGSEKDKPGDVFSDLFRPENQNRSSGNLESIYVWQVEEYTDGGTSGNAFLRNWGPFYVKIAAPDNKFNVVVDSMGRGVGRVRPSPYVIYQIWKDDPNDMRNSKYNWRRAFYYTNSTSTYFRKLIPPLTIREDTMRSLYPYPRKIEGKLRQGNTTSGRTTTDIYVYRLAETYLLRAEAYLRKGDAFRVNAAADINVVRSRANAIPVTPEDVTLEYILDERARELIAEEPRRRTLIRMGKLVERVRQYGLLETSKTTIQDYHALWPIPQTAIDANYGAKLEQNNGYNQ